MQPKPDDYPRPLEQAALKAAEGVGKDVHSLAVKLAVPFLIITLGLILRLSGLAWLGDKLMAVGIGIYVIWALFAVA